ncbi:hypothetical protein E2C01_080867 [Portunus trituberculatus]|uniref:Uncharacterized protein n=1 Tax=Portunus trituberculatus TaxID=210409 RepID=A0A5B7IUB0_PORTR|nr:hypothetical protein [Portunus trituberculatus]
MGVEAAREEASRRKQRRHSVKREVNSARLEKIARGPRKQDDQVRVAGCLSPVVFNPLSTIHSYFSLVNSGTPCLLLYFHLPTT